MAELTDGRLSPNWMSTAVDRAWIAMGRQREAENPGWKFRYRLMGFTAVRASDGLRIGPAGLRSVELQVKEADRRAAKAAKRAAKAASSMEPSRPRSCR